MDVKITILCENTVPPSLPVLGEHGFAAFIETENGNYLFDTGQGLSIAHNAKYLKKDLSTIKSVFLSHGHYDHTGGLGHVLKVRGRVQVFAHPDIFEKKYAAVRNNGQENKKYVGMQYERGELESLGAQFALRTLFEEVEKDIYLTGEVPRTTDYEKGDTRLLVDKAGSLLPDRIDDDQSLVLKTNQGLLIVLGCAHAGLINTLRHINGYFRHDRIHTIVGGTHLGFLTDDQLDKTIADLKDLDFQQLGASHCTGAKASARLFQEFGDRFFFAHAGTGTQL
jgi:7,8-dihydropterin-6-yl-methyl-4-(beta-D-ribofuranosyl)aminobenzene 5'-phosphate synthase